MTSNGSQLRVEHTVWDKSRRIQGKGEKKKETQTVDYPDELAKLMLVITSESSTVFID